MILDKERWFKWLGLLTMLAGAALVSTAVYTNVSVAVTSDDIDVFQQIGARKPTASLNFDQQIALIRKVQVEVFKRAPLGEGIPDYEKREPKDLMRIGQGLCFDRSRTFDKAFSYLGFETRHVYLLYKDKKSFFLSAVIHYGQSSHAVTEVKTDKGWMFVDSNTAWIALTRQGEPVNADDVWRRFGEFANPPAYLAYPWWAIRGMYSRKGQLYGSGVVFPEFNWPTFFSWVIRG